MLLGIATTQVVAKNCFMYCNDNGIVKYMRYILIQCENTLNLISFHTTHHLLEHAPPFSTIHFHIHECHHLFLNIAGLPPFLERCQLSSSFCSSVFLHRHPPRIRFQFASAFSSPALLLFLR